MKVHAQKVAMKNIEVVLKEERRITSNSQHCHFVTRIAEELAILAPTALRSSRDNVVNSSLVMRHSSTVDWEELIDVFIDL